MDKSEITFTENAEETKKLGEKLAARIVHQEGEQPFHIICLYGDLGMGKTTFVQGLARGLGITTRLLSPTFIIVRRHELPDIKRFFYHFDLYRMQSEANMKALGIQEIFGDAQNIVVVEWAERLESLLPDVRVDVRFTGGSMESARRVEMTYVKAT